jgi:hypothetical protein
MRQRWSHAARVLSNHLPLKCTETCRACILTVSHCCCLAHGPKKGHPKLTRDLLVLPDRAAPGRYGRSSCHFERNLLVLPDRAAAGRFGGGGRHLARGRQDAMVMEAHGFGLSTVHDGAIAGSDAVLKSGHIYCSCVSTELQSRNELLVIHTLRHLHTHAAFRADLQTTRADLQTEVYVSQ